MKESVNNFSSTVTFFGTLFLKSIHQKLPQIPVNKQYTIHTKSNSKPNEHGFVLPYSRLHVHPQYFPCFCFSFHTLSHSIFFNLVTTTKLSPFLHFLTKTPNNPKQNDKFNELGWSSLQIIRPFVYYYFYYYYYLYFLTAKYLFIHI